MFNLEQAMHAADLAALRSALRSVFADAVEGDDGIVSMACTVTHETPGLLVVEAEFRNRAGNAVGGFGL